MQTPPVRQSPLGLSPPAVSEALLSDAPCSFQFDGSSSLPSLLLVEESEADLYLTRELLKTSGVQNPVMSVREVGAAIMLLERAIRDPLLQSPPVVMFADLKLACEDGIPLIKWARSRSELDGMRIVVLSGSADPELHKVAIAAGADGYQSKFPEPAVIASLVADAMAGLKVSQ